MYREFKADSVKLQANINHFLSAVGIRHHARNLLPQHDNLTIDKQKQQHEESRSSCEVELVHSETASLLPRDEIK